MANNEDYERDQNGQFTIVEQEKKGGRDVYTQMSDDDLGHYKKPNKIDRSRSDYFKEVYKDLIHYGVISMDRSSLHPDITSDSDLRRFLGKDKHTSSEALYRGIRETQEFKHDANIRDAQAHHTQPNKPASVLTIPVKKKTALQFYKAGDHLFGYNNKKGIPEYGHVIVVHHKNGTEQRVLKSDTTGRFISFSEKVKK